MTSVAIKGSRYLLKPDTTDRLGPFNRTFLAAGDSWMDASTWRQGSLPEHLAEAWTRLGKTHLIVNVATSGQTLARMVNAKPDEFAWWLNQQPFDAILLSVGGLDFIEAARDVPQGQGLLCDMRGQSLPAHGTACVRQDQLQVLMASLNQAFEALHRTVRSSTRNANTPLFLNRYDAPVARQAPGSVTNSGPWLFAAYTKNGIPASLWDGLTEGLLGDLHQLITGWTKAHSGVFAVNTSGRLHRAEPNERGDSFDWANEVHPNRGGWKKQVPAWLDVLPP